MGAIASWTKETFGFRVSRIHTNSCAFFQKEIPAPLNLYCQ